MGQKVNPVGIRLGYIRESNARWFPDSQQSYADTLRSDLEIRDQLNKHLPATAAISNILIERTGSNVKALIRTAKPGVVIGKKGEDIERIRKKICDKYNVNLQVNIEEIRKPELEAVLVAKGVAAQLEKRIMFRRAMKRSVTSTMRQGALGIKIAVSGRLGGAEIARTEWYREGRVPLHTFRADIDYALAEAKTTYGIIGVKVWIYKGDVLDTKPVEEVQTAEAAG